MLTRISLTYPQVSAPAETTTAAALTRQANVAPRGEGGARTLQAGAVARGRRDFAREEAIISVVCREAGGSYDVEVV
jgi:hypothetical protein